MTSTFFGLNIAASGLRAANAALNTTANNINIDCIKKVLQFSNLDTEDRKLKTISYFKDKSNRTKEYLSAYLCAPQSTASSIMSILTTYINILGV